jgi:hypothetical protein
MSRETKTKSMMAALALLAMGTVARAETPFAHCVASGVVNVTTLPMTPDKMSHQLPGAGGKTLSSSAGTWFKLPDGTAIDLYVGYVDKARVEWDWGSAVAADHDNAIVTGWVKRSSLKCPR